MHIYLSISFHVLMLIILMNCLLNYFCFVFLKLFFRDEETPLENYRLEGAKSSESSLTGLLQSTVHPTQPALSVDVNILANGVVRLTVDEQSHTRYRVHDVLEDSALLAHTDVTWQLSASNAVATFSADHASYQLNVSLSFTLFSLSFSSLLCFSFIFIYHFERCYNVICNV